MDMSAASWAAVYGISVVVFLLVDLLWLGVVGKGLYDRYLGELLAEDVNWVAAITFYLIFLGGLCFFVLEPAFAAQSWQTALGRGAAFGFVTYATWDLTSLAVLKGFPGGIVPIDMAWGTVLAASVATGTYAAWTAISG